MFFCLHFPLAVIVPAMVPDIENIEPYHRFQTIVTVQWFQTAKRHVTNVKKLAKMFALGA